MTRYFLDRCSTRLHIDVLVCLHALRLCRRVYTSGEDGYGVFEEVDVLGVE